MLQKVIKVGNSLGVIIPSSFTRETGIKAGQQVAIEQNSQNKMLLIKPTSYADKPYLTPEFFDWLDKTAKKYKDVIKELANIK